MPPKRSKSRQKSAEQEGKIKLALQAYQKGQIKSLRAAAQLYNVPKTTLQDRAAGMTSRVDKRWHLYKLTQCEEYLLVKWVLSMDSRGAAPRPSTI
jgi:hypothetical protein